VVKGKDPTINRAIQFQIETRFRVYFLRADSEEDLTDWVQAINRLKSGIVNRENGGIIKNIKATRTRLSEHSPNRSGFLVKKGRTNKVWKKRFFCLHSGILSYYRSDNDEEPVGIIPLEGCAVSIADESLKRKFTFVISTRYRNYFLQAEDQFEMAGWVESIKFQTDQKLQENQDSFAHVHLFNRLNSILTAHEKLLEQK